jgi:hypothetical protein
MMSNVSVQTVPPVVEGPPVKVQAPIPDPVPASLSEPELSETESDDSRALTPDMIYPRKYGNDAGPIRMTGDMIMQMASVPQQSFVLTT